MGRLAGLGPDEEGWGGMMDGVSVVIPVSRSAQTVQRTLDSLATQKLTRPLEVLVMNNRSTDGSLEIVRAHPLCLRGTARIIDNPSGGLAHAYNMALKVARYEVFVTMHSDCYVTEPDALEKLLAPLDDKDVMAVAPTHLMTRAEWEKLDIWNRIAWARYVDRGVDGFLGKFDAIRASALRAVGGFAEQIFFDAGEDCDLVIKLQRLGRMVSTGVRVVHAHVFPADQPVKWILRKQWQLGESYGTLLRVWKGRMLRPPFLFLVWVHVPKLLLMLGLFTPWTWPYALGGLFLIGCLYTGRAFLIPDVRVILGPFLHILMIIVFVLGVVRSFVAGRQSFSCLNKDASGPAGPKSAGA